jgi:hypothetical protein
MTCRKIFPALICHHSRQGGGGGGEGHKTHKLPQKVSDGKKTTITYSCALSSMYMISQWSEGNAKNHRKR